MQGNHSSVVEVEEDAELPEVDIHEEEEVKVLYEKPRVWEGCRESRRYSRDTYRESYITKYTSIRRETRTTWRSTVFYF